MDQSGNPPVMVNALARDLKLCLAQRPAPEKRREPGVLRERLGQPFESCPGLQLLTMDAWYAERDLRQAIVNCGRDYMVRVKENRPDVLAALAGGLPAGNRGTVRLRHWKKSGRYRKTEHLDRRGAGRLYPGRVGLSRGETGGDGGEGDAGHGHRGGEPGTPVSAGQPVLSLPKGPGGADPGDCCG